VQGGDVGELIENQQHVRAAWATPASAVLVAERAKVADQARDERGDVCLVVGGREDVEGVGSSEEPRPVDRSSSALANAASVR